MTPHLEALLAEIRAEFDALLKGIEERWRAELPPADPVRWLRWPTPFKVITQGFLANPDYPAYKDFGGHEGIDGRAPNGTRIIAAADGEVSEVGWRSAGHPYGYAVRIRHVWNGWPYETLYGHLMANSAKVRRGQRVKAGDVIALADATGNVIPPGPQGAHVHFNLKMLVRDGAKPTPPAGIRYIRLSNGEILLDPLPFMVDAP